MEQAKALLHQSEPTLTQVCDIGKRFALRSGQHGVEGVKVRDEAQRWIRNEQQRKRRVVQNLK